MRDGKPRIIKNELYQLIRDDRIDEFNQRWTKGDRIDMRGLNFRNQDLRQLIVEDIDFSDCYFRGTDLRGLDMRSCNLTGATIFGAKISGVYFPEQISPQEIDLSLRYGTRMRHRS